MSEKQMPWFRLYTEIVNDPKIRLLSFEDRWHFVALLCLKGSGALDEEDAELRSNLVRLTVGLAPQEFEKMIARLAAVKLIDRKTLQPVAWDRRQRKSDHDGSANDRKRLERHRKKVGHEDVTRDTSVTSQSCHGNVTVSETETDTDKDKTSAANAAPGSVFAEKDAFFDVDPVKHLFDLGVPMLRSSGASERASRSLIGRLRGAMGDGDALSVLLSARRTTDPAAYIARAMAPKKQSGVIV